MYPALLPLMRTPRLPVVDWTDALPADLNGLVRLAERRNLFSARVPSHFKRSLRQWNQQPEDSSRCVIGYCRSIINSGTLKTAELRCFETPSNSPYYQVSWKSVQWEKDRRTDGRTDGRTCRNWLPFFSINFAKTPTNCGCKEFSNKCLEIK